MLLWPPTAAVGRGGRGRRGNFGNLTILAALMLIMLVLVNEAQAERKRHRRRHHRVHNRLASNAAPNMSKAAQARKRLPLSAVRNCEPCGGAKKRKTSQNRSRKRKHQFRIIGGKKSIHSRPWMAFVLILEDNRCAGSLLNARFVLTAAHCMCTHFACEKDEETGRRSSDFDPEKNIKIYLGLKDLKHVFEQEKSKGTSENEYFVSKVIVHPKYNDALFDIALMRTDRKVKLGRHVQPICLPLGPLFPDIRTDAKVAGWGTLKNTVCHTNDDGPSPNSQCAFPFRQPKEEGEEGGDVSQSCSYESNPSDVDRTCKEFRKQHPQVLVNAKSEALLYKDSAMNLTTGLAPERTCYAPHAGIKGWCATCKVAGDADDPHVCVEDRFEPASPEPDKNWGWCNKLCDDDHELLPHHLQEVTLVVFPPERCAKMFSVTRAPFAEEDEICAGYISKRKRRAFVIRKGDGKLSFSEVERGEGAGKFDLIGGKDACTGDSGAPLWIEMGKRTKRAFIIGVVSRGFNCASHNLPGIYVRVKRFLEWIRGNIEEGRAEECAGKSHVAKAKAKAKEKKK